MLLQGFLMFGVVGEVVDLVRVVGEVIEFFRLFLGAKEKSWVLFISPLAIMVRKALKRATGPYSWAA